MSGSSFIDIVDWASVQVQMPTAPENTSPVSAERAKLVEFSSSTSEHFALSDVSALMPSISQVVPRNDRLEEQFQAVNHRLLYLCDVVARQVSRAYESFSGTLERLDAEDQGSIQLANEKIANTMQLLGEPAIFATRKILLENNSKRANVDLMLSAMGSVDDYGTDSYRVEVLTAMGRSAQPQVRYSAINALSNMKSDLARHALEDLAKDERNPQILKLLHAHVG